jgi:hypothetical protein
MDPETITPQKKRNPPTFLSAIFSEVRHILSPPEKIVEQEDKIKMQKY